MSKKKKLIASRAERVADPEKMSEAEIKALRKLIPTLRTNAAIAEDRAKEASQLLQRAEAFFLHKHGRYPD